MKKGFREAATQFISASQTARVNTEHWASENMFCPSCGAERLTAFPANRPVADFFCEKCGDEYELKSQSKAFGRRVADGAYDTKIARLRADNAPHLLLLQYDRNRREVQDLCIIPKHLFNPTVIERRKPLAATARRAGWVGSNILLDRIPRAGRIRIIQQGEIRSRSEIIKNWKAIRFIERHKGDERTWLMETMRCIEAIGTPEFKLSEIYDHERELNRVFPNNKNVRAKLRQQLQLLRDSDYLEFLGNGHYRLKSP